MRVRKVDGVTVAALLADDVVSGYYDTYPSVNLPTTRYYYDGQTPVEEDYTTGALGQSSQKTVTRYAAGARGTDARYVTPPQQSETAAYPLYDAHGNAIAEVQKTASSPWFQLGNRRKYDAWGPVRWSQGSPPDQGYCANLGHRQDAESGLVYMRARYYDPGTGRFLSEDPARDGANWFAYAGNNPVCGADYTGRTLIAVLAELSLLFLEAKVLGPAAIESFLAAAEKVILDYQMMHWDSANHFKKLADAAYATAASATSAIEKDIALIIARADDAVSKSHRSEAALIGSVGRWAARMYAFMLYIDVL